MPSSVTARPGVASGWTPGPGLGDNGQEAPGLTGAMRPLIRGVVVGIRNHVHRYFTLIIGITEGVGYFEWG
eukprot:306151-Hanusia_phi.AAC.1